MSLHRLTRIVIGVPDVEATAAYYRDFGLTELGANRFATVDGGEQLAIAHARQRRLLQLGIGVHDTDDLDRIGSRLDKLGIGYTRNDTSMSVLDPNSSLTVVVEIADEIKQQYTPTPATNGPGRPDRANLRAPGIDRENPVRPRKLGHVVVGSIDQDASHRFFTDGLGFKITDHVPGLASFMRCSTDHHNVLVQQAPLNFLHHTAWEVDDVDEVGEYYSDIDCIIDEQLWKPVVLEGAKGLYSWGPPPPPSFVMPEDLAALMTGSHTAR
jgi:catechol 2,3-dioxygenase-like lactoylglutathione lyase family enzyme